MADGFRVNTDELEAVVRRLRTIQQNMSQTSEKSRYGTAVAREDFGVNFSHATALYDAHDNMHRFLNETIAGLDSLINEFGNKTHTVTENYKARDAEYRTVMTKYQQELD
ncbi:hypothetical protein OG871_15175 [Kitasatospora sp. NBC_00374]|uniref:hypothetical protein n=1 Tax=Kitasatospora sp. NBC_00374 TaxID=2975964 RepID=UPI00324A8639